MKKISIIYGTSSGKTEYIANKISNKFKDKYEVNLFNVASLDDNKLNEINNSDYFILGSSTWGIGDLQDDWEVFDFTKLKLENKKVALFGLGDCIVFAFTFCDAIKKLEEKIINQNPIIVGSIQVDGIQYDNSLSANNNLFIGLPIDDDNHPELTEKNIDFWTNELIKEFK